MLSPRLDRALVLGMGSGATAGVVAPVFARTDVVEINRVVLDNLHRMAQYNLEIERRPSVRIIHDDGIHWIKTTSTQYSLILNTVTSPRYFSSSKLYTSDFFGMVRRRLTPDGVYVTWLDGRIGDRGLDIILETLRGAFARCWLSYLRSNYFFLACSNGQLGLHQFGPVAANPELRRYFADAFALPVRMLPYGVLSIDAFALQGLRPAPLNTLNFPVLEFEMARLGAATPLREFKRRLETQLDLARVQAATAPFAWNAAEFAVAAHVQLPPGSQLARTLTTTAERQRGVLPQEYDRAAQAFVDELGTADAYYTYGRRFLRVGRHAAAVQALARAVALDPARGDARYELGLAYRASGAYGSALTQFVAAWDVHRESRAPLRASAMLLELGRYAEALTWLARTREVLRGRPTATVLYYEGVAREGLGDRALAVADYEAALKRDPEHDRSRAALHRLRTSPSSTRVVEDYRQEAHDEPQRPRPGARAARGEAPPETESMPRGAPEGP
jgi:tetratricopeptide (TPR) repeat protein